MNGVRTERVPIDNATRGRLRAWKRTALQRYKRVAQACQTEAFEALVRDFYSKRGRGRQRALAKLKNILKEARFVQARLNQRPPHALWAILDPRNSVICNVPGVDAGRLQDCVTVDCIAVGRLSAADGTLACARDAGVWTLEAQDHALG